MGGFSGSTFGALHNKIKSEIENGFIAVGKSLSQAEIIENLKTYISSLGWDNYNNLSNLPNLSINGTEKQVKGDVVFTDIGTKDYNDLSNKPHVSINGVDKEIKGNVSYELDIQKIEGITVNPAEEVSGIGSISKDNYDKLMLNESNYIIRDGHIYQRQYNDIVNNNVVFISLQTGSNNSISSQKIVLSKIASVDTTHEYSYVSYVGYVPTTDGEKGKVWTSKGIGQEGEWKDGNIAIKTDKILAGDLTKTIVIESGSKLISAYIKKGDIYNVPVLIEENGSNITFTLNVALSEDINCFVVYVKE